MTTKKELLDAIAKENGRQLISGCEDAGEVNKIYGNVRLLEQEGEKDDNIFHLDEVLEWYVYALNTVTKAEIPIEGIMVKNTYDDGSVIYMQTMENGKARFKPLKIGRVTYEVPNIINNIGAFDVVE
jgi:hypothetical protein